MINEEEQLIGLNKKRGMKTEYYGAANLGKKQVKLPKLGAKLSV